MKKCNASCQPCCDRCTFFDFNGEDYAAAAGIVWRNAIYTGNGWCNKHARNTDPGWYCDDFWCERAVESGENGVTEQAI